MLPPPTVKLVDSSDDQSCMPLQDPSHLCNYTQKPTVPDMSHIDDVIDSQSRENGVFPSNLMSSSHIRFSIVALIVCLFELALIADALLREVPSRFSPLIVRSVLCPASFVHESTGYPSRRFVLWTGRPSSVNQMLLCSPSP